MDIDRRIQRNKSWNKLDNAAMFFPSTIEKTDTRVFRFYCELTEDVIPNVLQSAVEYTLETFPNFKMVMKKGMFWYYLEESDLIPNVTLEDKAVCSPIYDDNKKELLFNVTFFKNRINLEVYHVITDGTGALQFLKNIVSNYLVEAHKERFKDNIPIVDDATVTERNSDSFKKYYAKNKNFKQTPTRKAYNFKMEKRDAECVQIIEGIVSTKQVIDIAHRYNTTLTVYLTAIFIEAIAKEMTVQQMKKPIVIMVPVNLRNYFPSETARNFFGMIGVSYDFNKGDGTLENIISRVNKSFKHELTKERLVIRMNNFASLERNPFIKIVPRPIKNVVLRVSRHIKDLNETAVISNIGKVTMPDILDEYIDKFGVLISTLKLQLCICSYKDNLQIGFTSSFLSTDVQKNLFRTLSKNGVSVEIRTNDYYLSQKEVSKAYTNVKEKQSKK
ncbi:MAG: hypothetical protein LUG94_03515 [Ruminococcus sp.]|nr:hypothetical protein [Ruminococcus sp.]